MDYQQTCIQKQKHLTKIYFYHIHYGSHYHRQRSFALSNYPGNHFKKSDPELDNLLYLGIKKSTNTLGFLMQAYGVTDIIT